MSHKVNEIHVQGKRDSSNRLNQLTRCIRLTEVLDRTFLTLPRSMRSFHLKINISTAKKCLSIHRYDGNCYENTDSRFNINTQAWQLHIRCLADSNFHFDTLFAWIFILYPCAMCHKGHISAVDSSSKREKAIKNE